MRIDEQIYKIEIPEMGYLVRIWYANPSGSDPTPERIIDFKEHVREARDASWLCLDNRMMAIANCLIDQLKLINAIEVSDLETGAGVLIYPEWP